MTADFRKAWTESRFHEALEGRGTLLESFPFHPIESPGFPKAGPNFTRVAKELAGSVECYAPASASTRREAVRLTKERHQTTVGLRLNQLYYHALYDDAFNLSIEFKGRPVPVRFILGHRWGDVPDGPRPSRIMVVGKNPGRDEEREAANFVGPTSQLFKEALEEVGFTDHPDWYMTNVVRFCNINPATDNLPAAWVADCLPILYEELCLVQPEFILLLGAEAISAVLGKGNKFKNTNGRVIELTIPDPTGNRVVKVVTCPHPASVARRPEGRDDMMKALHHFRRVTHGVVAELRDPEQDREHLHIQSAEELAQLVRRLQEEDRRAFAIDCEWNGDTPLNGWLATTQFSWAPRTAAVVEWRDVAGQPCFKGGIAAGVQLLRELLEGPDRRIIGHYFNADLWWLKDLGLGFLQEQFLAPKDDPDPDGSERFFGWQKTAWEGGFDTILAAHAHEETTDLGLKELAIKHTTVPNYEVQLEEWKKVEAKRLKCGVKELPGYGGCPRDILVPYAAYDADATFRLFELYNAEGGFLDRDRFGNSCRLPFWRSMRAALAFYEMRETGAPVDMTRVYELTRLYQEIRASRLDELQRLLGWPEFNPASPIQCKELLFGEAYNGKLDKATGRSLSVRPEGALSLMLRPYKSTGKRPKLWDKIRARGEEDRYTPAVDKETLTVYAPLHPAIQLLLDLRYVSQVLRYVLRPPRTVDGVVAVDDNGDPIYDRGMLSYLQPDGRIHTNFSQTKETRRASSWQPPMQNLSKKREPDLKRIAGSNYTHAMRSVFEAPPGWAFVSADYTGAELMGMAVQAGDRAMIDYCRRATLPGKGYDEAGNKVDGGKFPHPDFLDLHSDVAIEAFRIKDPETGQPLQQGRLSKYHLGRLKLDHLRDAAKPVDFGYAYGMTAEAAYRRAREGGADVTPEDAQALIDGLERKFPALPAYFTGAAARSRDPRFLCSCFGGYRRTHYTSDPAAQGDLERQFKNFPIQTLVADAVNDALAAMYDYRQEYPHLRFLFTLQIHDDIVLLVPVEQVPEVYNEVIPYCMHDCVDIWPCDFDGNVKPDPDAPYHLSPGRSVYLRWGEKLPREQAIEAGIDWDALDHD